MNIILFSDNKNIKNIFIRVEKTGTHTIQILPLKDLKKTVREIKTHCLLYIDVSFLNGKKLNGVLNSLNKATHIRFGVMDPRETITDKAAVFFKGAADYLGRAQCKEGISADRIKGVLAFKPAESHAPRPGLSTANMASAVSSNVLRARSWNMVQPGSEYLFYMMFVELDGHHEISQRVGEKALESLLSSFQFSVEHQTAAEKGRLWIWNDFGGIVLFPFTNKPSAIIASCMRFMFSRRVISIERCAPKMLLSYRIVLHTGSTVYRERGKTGRIISDAVNSLSHMGNKFAQPGNMYITEEIFSKTPQALQDCFKKAGQFQSFELYRMKLPLKY
jgi:class 3 adenylate cyclase